MATRDPGPREDRGTNTALVVVVVILVAALIGVFIWWGTNDDPDIQIDLPDNDIGLVEAAPTMAAGALPMGIRIPLV